MPNLRLLFSDNNAAAADFAHHCFQKDSIHIGGANLERDKS